MAHTEGPDEMVKSAMVITRKQHDALREAASKDERSMSWFIRKALDRWFGFDRAAIDPRATEQDKVA